MQHQYVAVIMGIVEGLTEFLPVSSTGHLILTGEFLNFVGPKAATFEIIIQLGAILAVVILYYERLLTLRDLSPLREKNILQKVFSSSKKTEKLNIIHIIVSTVPALFMGYLLHGYIKRYLFSSNTVVIGLVGGGIVMILAERRLFELKTKSLDDVSFKQAMVVGLAQCCSLWPGVSRAASTILGGIYIGMDYKTAAEFSFLISIPVMFAATGYDIMKNWHILNLNDFGILAIGFTVSFVVALITVKTFLKIFQKLKLSPFGWYRIAIGLAFFFLISK